MKKILLTMALAFSLTLPMTSVQAGADWRWYKTNNPGAWVDIYSKPGYRQGRFHCRVPHGQYLEVQPSRFFSGSHVSADGKYIYATWTKRIGTMEWHWRDGMTNKWCPIWNRRGWLEKRLLIGVNFPGGHWIW